MGCIVDRLRASIFTYVIYVVPDWRVGRGGSRSTARRSRLDAFRLATCSILSLNQKMPLQLFGGAIIAEAPTNLIDASYVLFGKA